MEGDDPNLNRDVNDINKRLENNLEHQNEMKEKLQVEINREIYLRLWS